MNWISIHPNIRRRKPIYSDFIYERIPIFPRPHNESSSDEYCCVHGETSKYQQTCVLVCVGWWKRIQLARSVVRPAFDFNIHRFEWTRTRLGHRIWVFIYFVYQTAEAFFFLCRLLLLFILIGTSWAIAGFWLCLFPVPAAIERICKNHKRSDELMCRKSFLFFASSLSFVQMGRFPFFSSGAHQHAGRTMNLFARKTFISSESLHRLITTVERVREREHQSFSQINWIISKCLLRQAS